MSGVSRESLTTNRKLIGDQPGVPVRFFPLTLTSAPSAFYLKLATRNFGYSGQHHYCCIGTTCRGLFALLLHFISSLFAVELHCSVMSQNVFLCLAIHYLNVVLSEVDDIYPVTGRVRYFRFCG